MVHYALVVWVARCMVQLKYRCHVSTVPTVGSKVLDGMMQASTVQVLYTVGSKVLDGMMHAGTVLWHASF